MRSFAILMMLQGHFIGLSYKNFYLDINQIKTLGSSGSFLFDSWYFMKGYTAPLFFFVTGLIFTFLLLREESLGKLKIRIKKGLNRSLELLIYGYLLQLSLFNFLEIFASKPKWIFAFHVLQCIGLGLILIILIFRFQKIIKFIPLGWLFLLSGIFIFSLYGIFHSQPELLTGLENIPEIIQNIIDGPNSVFPIFPWMGFIFFGAATGFWVYHNRSQIFSYKFSLIILFVSIFLIFCNPYIYRFMIYIEKTTSLNLFKSAWMYERLGHVLFSMFIFMRLEKLYRTYIGKFFVKIGQKTLFIYTWHVIVLYGGIFGLGLNQIIKQKLTIEESIIGAVIFIIFFLFFSIYSHFFDDIKLKFLSSLKKIFKFRF